MEKSTFFATLQGCFALVLWGALALLTSYVQVIPPFFLMALTFSIAGGSGLVFLVWKKRLNHLKQPISAWILGVFGLFGYHAFYFSALKWVSPVEASLINYTWPLWIVIFAGFLPGETLSFRAILGAFLGFFGTCLLILSKGSEHSISATSFWGYSFAALAALVWASYSVLSRRFSYVPTDTVVGYCLATALLALLSHFFWEETVWPQDMVSWVIVFVLGLGPVGVAFFLWDIGVKKGNLYLLGAASYATPLLSTFLLIAFGRAAFNFSLLAACLLIAGGAFIAKKSNKKNATLPSTGA